MATDPHQLHNVADHPDYRAIRASLEQALHNWMRVTGDPLLQGHLTPPRNSIVNHRDSISPHQNFYIDCLITPT